MDATTTVTRIRNMRTGVARHYAVEKSFGLCEAVYVTPTLITTDKAVVTTPTPVGTIRWGLQVVLLRALLIPAPEDQLILALVALELLVEEVRRYSVLALLLCWIDHRCFTCVRIVAL